jgi:tRNA/rRNA methyltransferase
MPSFRVVLVNPKIEGNIGAVARTMGNFGFKELVMVGPCELGDDAYRRAKHAGHLLDSARVVDTLDEAIEGCSMVVGTSGIVTEGEKHFVRIPITARELAERLGGHEGEVAILFGREGLGLFQEELMRCDILVHVPTSREYPVLNLSHAVSIVLYELYQSMNLFEPPRPATEIEREVLFERFSELLDAIDYPEFRRERTEVMFRRLMGRAVPTKWEFYTLVGIIGDAGKMLKK